MPRLLLRKECLRRGKHLENGGIMEEEEEEEDGGVESGSNIVSLKPQDNLSPYAGRNCGIF